MTRASLREELIGAWRLVSYEERPLDGSPATRPMGDAPVGLLLYTPDGFMSAQLSMPDRAPFPSGDWFVASDAEFRAEASSYIAYSGTFAVDEENRQLTHSMTLSLFPNWVGQTQPRVVRLKGDALSLSTAISIFSDGKLVMPHLQWRRARSSS